MEKAGTPTGRKSLSSKKSFSASNRFEKRD